MMQNKVEPSSTLSFREQKIPNKNPIGIIIYFFNLSDQLVTQNFLKQCDKKENISKLQLFIVSPREMMGFVGISGTEIPTYLNYSLCVLEIFQWGKKGKENLCLSFWDELRVFLSHQITTITSVN